MTPSRAAALSLILLAVSSLAAAQSDLTAIQDNSFLVEEAYNQEAGVVQHISFFIRDQRTHDWIYTFTQEWPVASQKHQLSYTVPVTRAATQRRVGDVIINYRYQLAGSGDTKMAIAPRVSVVIPTADSGNALQVALPISYVVSNRIVAHSNAGATFYRDHRPHDLALGQSFIYALNSRVHVMAEAMWTRTNGERDLVVSPGLRWAYNLKSGLQIVPGIAVPIGIGHSAGERSVAVYLSFEHPFH